MRSTDPALIRPRLVQRVQHQLVRHSWPRVQMSFLVALTAGAGLLASFLLLQAGFQAMWLRYPLALGVAYLVFLVLLWLWLRTRAEDYVDAPQASGDGGSASCSEPAPDISTPVSGGGGDFSGGGASAGFDASAAPAHLAELDAKEANPLSEGLGSVADADEFAIPLIVVLLAIGMVLSSLYVVYVAPALFAELLLDGALASTLYRRLRGLDSRHWIETAVRRTATPFALTAAFLCASGAAMQGYAPQAQSLGDFLQHAASRP